MDRRMADRWAVATAALLAVSLWGCSQGSDPAQYKTYDQLLSDQTATTDTRDAASDDSAQESVTDKALDAASDDSGTTSSADVPVLPVSALGPVNVVDGTAVAAVLDVSPPNPADASPGAIVPASAASTNGVPAAKPLPGGIQLLVPKRDFRAEGPNGAVRVSYDDLDLLKVVNMEPVPTDAVDHFPDWLHGLNGKRIRIRGFMFPTFESSGLEGFVLARDNQICCFGRNPKIYDLIQVGMRPGSTTDYIPNRPFDVVGNFHIEMVAEGGKLMGLYWIDDAQVMTR
jgi:hypothetical protein